MLRAASERYCRRDNDDDDRRRIFGRYESRTRSDRKTSSNDSSGKRPLSSKSEGDVIHQLFAYILFASSQVQSTVSEAG